MAARLGGWVAGRNIYAQVLIYLGRRAAGLGEGGGEKGIREQVVIDKQSNLGASDQVATKINNTVRNE